MILLMQDNREQEILALLQKGATTRAFQLLVKEYSRRIYWHVRHMLNDHEDSNDVVQNVFIKIWENLDGFRGDAKLYTWIYRIASNEALNFIQQKKRKLRLVQEAAEVGSQQDRQTSPNPDGEAVYARLQNAIQQLPEKQRLVFNLRYFEEMPYEEMAGVTETSVGALKASYHHAVKKIEELLKAD